MVSFLKLDFTKCTEITYQDSKDYIEGRPYRFSFNGGRYYLDYTDKRIATVYDLTPEMFKEYYFKILKKIYSNVINFVIIDRKLVYHSSQKQFEFWKRYSRFKKYQKSILFFNLPKAIINKIAWCCV